MNAPDPGPGYRLLKEGELIEVGDQIFQHGNGNAWIAVQAKLVGLVIGSTSSPYRRKVDDEDRWIALSERLPDKFPCQVWDGEQVYVIRGLEAMRNGSIFGDTLSRNRPLSHWKPLKLSDPPEPQKSKEELGFDEWYAAHGKSLHHPFDAWLAALQWKERNG